MILLVSSISIFKTANAQEKYVTTSGKISFVAIEHPTVDAISNSVSSILNAKTHEFTFSVPVKSFEFKKSDMMAKFNAKIMETERFPLATFTGELDRSVSVNFQQDNNYPVTVKGKLSMHGVTKDITAKGNLIISKGIVNAVATFTISINDYQVTNPGIGDGMITIRVDSKLKPARK